MISQLNTEQRWINNWQPDPVPTGIKVPAVYTISKDGKISKAPQEEIAKPANVACRQYLKRCSGRKSGRASVTCPGKASRSSNRRVSAKSSVTRPH